MRQQQGHERVPEPGTRRTAAAAATAPAATAAFAAGSLSAASPGTAVSPAVGGSDEPGSPSGTPAAPTPAARPVRRWGP